MDRIRFKLGMQGCIAIDSSPSCTGLAIIWNNKTTIDLLSYSDHHIDVIIHFCQLQFHFSGVHGFAETTNKYKTWQLMDTLQSASSLPWLLGGDFNEILHDNEKQGGIRRVRSQINNFRDCL